METRREIVVGGPRPEVEHYVHAGIGRPPAFDIDSIEAVLWEVAVQGGNLARAMRLLKESDESNGVVRELPGDRTVRRWITSQYRNRFHEICQGRSRDLEETVAQNAIALSLQAQAVKEDALRAVAARINECDAVEASTVLRNIANSNKSDLDGAMAIRRAGAQAEDSRTLRHMADALVRLGAAKIVESTADDITDARLVEGGGGTTPPAL